MEEELVAESPLQVTNDDLLKLIGEQQVEIFLLRRRLKEIDEVVKKAAVPQLTIAVTSAPDDQNAG